MKKAGNMANKYSSGIIEAFRLITTASVSDALNQLGVKGYMSQEIKPILPAKIVGPAVTVREIPTSEQVPPTLALQAIDESEQGSIIVIDVGEFRDVAVWGGLMTAGAVASGLEGAVLDGGVRDVEEIRRDFRFPVFSRSISPATTVGSYKTISLNEPVVCGGVTVNSGDLIVGDSDGIVVVPADKVEQTLEIAREIEAREKEQTKLILEAKSIRKGLEKYQRI